MGKRNVNMLRYIIYLIILYYTYLMLQLYSGPMEKKDEVSFLISRSPLHLESQRGCCRSPELLHFCRGARSLVVSLLGALIFKPGDLPCFQILGALDPCLWWLGPGAPLLRGQSPEALHPFGTLSLVYERDSRIACITDAVVFIEIKN